MRIAVMIPGLCRTFRDTAPSLEKHLFNVNPGCEFDIFVETWDIEGNFVVNSKATGHQDLNQDWLDRDARSNSVDLFAAYNPVYFNSEPFEPWRERAIPRAQELSRKFGGGHDGRFLNSVLAQYYKIDKAFRAIEDRMEFQGEYDLVIKNRFDNDLVKDIKITEELVEMCSDTFVHGDRRALDNDEFKAHQKKGLPVMDDQFGLVGVKPCKAFCSLYDDIEDVVASFLQKGRFQPYSEFFSAFNLELHGFRLKRGPIMHSLVRK